jgi:hypothetical protein
VAPKVLGLEARELGGETVSPTAARASLSRARRRGRPRDVVQVVVRAPCQFTGERELGYSVEEPDGIQRGFEDRAKVQWSSVGGGSSCGSYWGWDVP